MEFHRIPRLPGFEVRGLMNIRREFGPYKPLKGARITGSSRMFLPTAVLIETLTSLGAEVRWCSSDIWYAQGQVSTDIARDSACVFTLNSETRQEYWRCIDRALDWGPGGGPDLIVDESTDSILLILEGVKAEKIYAETDQLPDPCSTDDTELQAVLTIIKDGLKTNPNRYRNMAQRLGGFCLGTTNCIERLLQMQANGTLSFPVININDSVTNSEFCEMFRGPILGKKALVCGYGDDASRGCAMALKQGGADVVVVEADLKHATKARLRGFSVFDKAPDNVVSKADIIVTDFNMDNINVPSNVKNMKNNVVIYNTGHHSSTYVPLIEPCFSGMEQIIHDRHTGIWVNSDTEKGVIIVSHPECPNLVPAWSATRYVVALLEFMSQKETGKYVGKVYRFSEHLEEVVADLHLGERKATVVKRETEGRAAADLVSGPSQERANPFTTTTAEGRAAADLVSGPSQERANPFTTTTVEGRAAADLVSGPSQERANPFTTTTAEAMNRSKMLVMIIQLVPIIGALAYALSKAAKAELSFSAIWGDGN